MSGSVAGRFLHLWLFDKGEAVEDMEMRPLEERDLAAVTAIINATEAPWQTTEAEARQEDADLVAAGGVVIHWVAARDGAVAGHGVLRGRESADRRQEYTLELRVHPDRPRQGVGASLWKQLEGDLETLLPTIVRVWVRERYPEALQFAERRGFTEVSRSGIWTLDVAAADVELLRSALERAAVSGVTISSLAAERERNPECLSDLHALRMAVDADIPSVEPYPVVSYTDFEREADGALPGGFLVARRGDEYVGLTCLHRNAGNLQEFHQSITGVRSDCRHLGIATALKARGILFARSEGYERIVTYVDSTNAPMAALNKKLGFVGGNDAVLMERLYNTRRAL